MSRTMPLPFLLHQTSAFQPSLCSTFFGGSIGARRKAQESALHKSAKEMELGSCLNALYRLLGGKKSIWLGVRVSLPKVWRLFCSRL